MTARRSTTLLLAALLAWAAPARVAGQAGEARAGTVSGRVVDAETGSPVEGATVVLEPEVGGAFPGPAAFAAATRTITTGATGAYRFDALSPGLYRLYVARYSYHPYTVVVELRGRSSPVSVGLDAAPIGLEPLRGRGRARGPYVAADAFADDAGLARLMVTDLRRRRYLTTDVRELTHADVVEGVTLGEPDVFRALQRLPGVSTRSDYTAELWTRGAPWSQTRVYFDGVPLFNPLHALGILSGIGSSAVGAVWFHPGVRSAGIGEGAAGVIDLRSRGAHGAGELGVRGDLSLMTAGLALDQRVLDGRAGWMVAGRSTHLDWLTELADRAAGRDDHAFPYGFREVTGRVDVGIGARSGVEASWLWEGDRLTNEGVDDVEPLRADWGNALARISLDTRLPGGASLRHDVGFSEHRGQVLTDEVAAIPLAASARRLGETAVRWVGVSGTLAPEPTSLAGPDWSVGWSAQRHAVDYFGPLALPVPRSEAMTFATAGEPPAGPLDTTRVAWASTLPVGVVWGERSWRVEDRLAVRAGLRLEASTPVAGSGAVRAAPRLSVRYSPIPEASLSAGYARVWQYAQALAPGGVQLASLVSTDVWLLAGEGVPALRSDVATAGLEAWIGPGRVVALNVFGRHSTDLVLPDPHPGPVFERGHFVAGTGLAVGLEASVRQLAGPLTGSVSYSLSRSRVSAVGLEFPSSADRTHVFDLTAMTRPLPSLRLGAAFTAATGVPFTRTIGDSTDCAAEPGCDPERLPWADAPHGVRAPAFASLDLLADWTVHAGRTEVGLYAQLRNVLGRDNATVYTGDGSGCMAVGCSTEDLRNAYERGLPRLPVLGLRVRR